MNSTNKHRSFWQFFTFSMIAGFNGLIDIGTINLLLILFPTRDATMLTVFNSIAYVLAVTNSYYWNSRLTFKYSRSHKRGSELILFVVQALVSLVISNIVFVSAIYILDVLPVRQFIVNNISKGLAMLLSSLASFFFMKYIVFRKKQPKHSVLSTNKK
ncbi:GtrA family protein [Bacillus sp. HMF5848]|uniref:GtrA family protein n=1 Tax=Bacillus sp. HMF5848 TaxID=2495421 RepID=UPI000F785979|nr:GtrA family protein [Bacillus sp. HMF5848]RSK26697.1 GtrA family protein [Bacillus sp. HMF5848]